MRCLHRCKHLAADPLHTSQLATLCCGLLLLLLLQILNCRLPA
jgi:hypothetical protein